MEGFGILGIDYSRWLIGWKRAEITRVIEVERTILSKAARPIEQNQFIGADRATLIGQKIDSKQGDKKAETDLQFSCNSRHCDTAVLTATIDANSPILPLI